MYYIFIAEVVSFSRLIYRAKGSLPIAMVMMLFSPSPRLLGALCLIGWIVCGCVSHIRQSHFSATSWMAFIDF